MATASLEQVYTYHRPFGTQPGRYEAIRQAGRVLAELIRDTAPPSRETSVALTKVQEAVMWANAAIAINEREEPAAAGNVSPVLYRTYETVQSTMIGVGPSQEQA